jgi:hypothetical protein
MRSCSLITGLTLLCCLCTMSVMPLPAMGGTTNLLSLQEGCLPVTVPSTYGGWDAQNLLDDSPTTGWANETGNIKNNVFVFELAAEATLEGFEFDNAGVDAEGAAAREILVEVSNESASAGFNRVLQTTLADITDGQTFKAEKTLPGRWLRLTILTNHGNAEYTELFGLRGYGEKPEPGPSPAISGTYSSTYSDFHVRQQGSALAGCYEYSDGLLAGAIEGRIMKITWQEGPDSKGPAILVFAADGKSFNRLTTAGFGPSQPVSDNDTELGRARNRRVELVRR